MSTIAPPDRDVGLQGHYAGPVTRLTSLLIDVAAITVVFAAGGAVVEFLVSAVAGHQFRLTDAPGASIAALAGWTLLYCAYPLAVAGRTLGMAVVGVRAVHHDGSDLSAAAAIVRVLVFPLSFLLFGLGFLPIIVRRDHRALHDVISGAAVVYAWDARAARLRFLVRTT